MNPFVNSFSEKPYFFDFCAPLFHIGRSFGYANAGGEAVQPFLITALRRKLCLIYSLNIADWICTVTLLSSGGFFEANPLMRPVLGDVSLGFLVKGILPAFLLLFVGHMAGSLGKGARWVDRCAGWVLALYTALCAVHIVNFAVWLSIG